MRALPLLAVTVCPDQDNAVQARVQHQQCLQHQPYEKDVMKGSMRLSTKVVKYEQISLQFNTTGGKSEVTRCKSVHQPQPQAEWKSTLHFARVKLEQALLP